MKAESGSLAGSLLTPLTPPEPSGPRLAAQNQRRASFTEHLHSAEAKRLSARRSPKEDVPVAPGKDERLSATHGGAVKNSRPAKPAHPAHPVRPPGWAHRINAPRDPEPKAKTGPATDISDSAGATPSTARDEEELWPDEATRPTAPANQVTLVPPPIAFIPPVVQAPTPPLTATEEVAPATVGVSEIAWEASRAPGSADLPPARAVASEKKDAASALALEQAKPDAPRETLVGDSDGSDQGESQVPGREDEPHLDSLTPPAAGVVGQVDGTVAAKQPLPMKNGVEMEKSAGPEVKNLPGTERAPEVPVLRVLSRVEVAREARHDVQADAAVPNFSTPPTWSSVTSTETGLAAPASEVSAVERVARAIQDGVARMRHTGLESVSVVLKPDAGTELLLRVEMRDGALSAQLHFERGDRSVLNQHWDELHRRLAEQGVRLSRGDDAGLGGNAQFAQSQRQPLIPEEDSMAAGPAGFNRTISNNQTMTRPPARGFETWA